MKKLLFWQICTPQPKFMLDNNSIEDQSVIPILTKKQEWHSSRMRAVRCSGHVCVCVVSAGGVCPGGGLLRGMSA